MSKQPTNVWLSFFFSGDDGSASILKPGKKKLKKVAAARVPKDAANRGSRQRNPSKQPVTDDDALPSQPKEQHTVVWNLFTSIQHFYDCYLLAETEYPATTGEKDTPCGRPTVFGGFSYYWLLLLINYYFLTLPAWPWNLPLKTASFQTVVHRVADDEFLEMGLGSGGTFKTRGRATPGIEPNQKKNRSQKQKRKGR
jgi:hypothetical protein